MKKKEAFKVIQDKKVPESTGGRPKWSTKYPFDTMKVNSYFVTTNNATAALGSNRAKGLGRSERFTLRTVNGELRCYRIK